MNHIPMVNNAKAPSLEELQNSYGFRHTPFQLTEKATTNYPSPGAQTIIQQLNTTAAMRSVMLLTGAPGTGKSTLVKTWVKNLDPKRYVPLYISQSTLTASGVLENMLNKLGHSPRLKRSTNLNQLEKALEEAAPAVPILILDDAQNYLSIALEEIRLLLGLGANHRSPLALILIGDEYLLGSLRLSSQKALYSRIGASAQLRPLPAEEIPAYLDWHVRQAGLERAIYSPPASQLIATASEGNARLINHLAQAAWLAAARSGATTIEPEHVHLAMQQVPATAAKIPNNNS